MNADLMLKETEPLERLLASTANGDQSAFARLYAASSAKLFGIILRILRNNGQAEEVLQEVYVSIWQRGGDYRPDKGSPMTWMITIARNRAIDRLRATREVVPLDDVAEREGWVDPAPDPLQQTMSNADARALGLCLGELGAEQRDCLQLAFLYGYTHKELSHRLERPAGTIKSWIRRGLLQLRACLER